MRKLLLTFLVTLAFFLTGNNLFAQDFNGIWECQYATYDNADNGPGSNTIDVGVLAEDHFVALTNSSSRGTFYLVAYKDADSASGKLSDVPYNTAFSTLWSFGFESYEVTDAYSVDVSKSDSLIFVANNDSEHNILVFKFTENDFESAPYRLPTGEDMLRAIEIDGFGHVYVTSYDTTNDVSNVTVYESVYNEIAWSDPLNITATPLQEFQVPGNGEARGIAVNNDGTNIWVANYDNRNIYKFTGDVENGFTIDNNFSFEKETMIFDPEVSADTLYAGPWGLGYLEANNLLFVAHDVNFALGLGYYYGMVYTVHPETGEDLDSLDVFMWNYIANDSSTSRIGVDNPGNASGYVSVYNIDFDENGNFYSQSYYGWTAEKWSYTGTLPILTSLEVIDNTIPDNFNLSQNYPNPFNPSTTIEFSVTEANNVSLKIYSVNGELIATVIDNQEFSSGVYKATIDGSNLASGVYIYTLTAGNKQLSKKMTLLK